MKPLAVVGIVLCLFGWLGMACQAPSPPSTSAPTPAPTRTPTPTPGPLTDAEAIALVKEEVAARGVAPHTLSVTIAGEPRSASIRYSSSYTVDSSVFRAQTVPVALACGPSYGQGPASHQRRNAPGCYAWRRERGGAQSDHH